MSMAWRIAVVALGQKSHPHIRKQSNPTWNNLLNLAKLPTIRNQINKSSLIRGYPPRVINDWLDRLDRYSEPALIIK